MSDSATLPAQVPVDETAAALRAAELFADLPAGDLERLVSAIRRLELGAGETLWRQGTEADGLHIIVTGEVAISSRLPGEREVELARLGPGEAMGEIPLIDGGLRTAGARTTKPTTLLFLSRPDFAALISSLLPSAFALRKSVITTVASRVRRRHAVLAASVGGAPPRRRPQATAVALELAFERADPPPMSYLTRLPFFCDFRPEDISTLLGRARVVAVPSHTVVLAEGEAPARLWLTINGAVERVIARDERRIRVGLSGPGRTFGYPGVPGVSPSSITAMTRERAVLFALPAAQLMELIERADPFSRQFLDALQRDIVMALREAERPHARLAAATPAQDPPSTTGAHDD